MALLCALVAAPAAHARNDSFELPVDKALAGKDRYAHFLTLPKPRAFAFLEDGTWRFWADDPDAIAKVFADCERLAKRCWLYAVDDRVVWNADERLRIGSVAQLTAPLAAKDEHE